MRTLISEVKTPASPGAVYCPMCTHTVQAALVTAARRTKVVAGQKCPRCASPLDAAYVWQQDRAA